MPDITLCSSLVCSKRWKCARHLSRMDFNNLGNVSMWQSMADLTPQPGKECQNYIHEAATNAR